jgi:hypothetical protein
MLLAQVLKGLLIQAIYVFVIIPENREQLIEFEKNGLNEEWENFVDLHNEKLIRKTMGKLLEKLKCGSAIDLNIEASLKSALMSRNYLAHSFYKEWLPKLYTEAGQDSAVLFLRQSGAKLQQSINYLTIPVESEMEKYGYDSQYLEEYSKSEIFKAQKNL